MAEIIDPKHTDTHVGQAIETLGSGATTKAIADLTGFAQSTVATSAMRLGYVKSGTYNGVWLTPTTDVGGLSEVVEVLNRLTDLLADKLDGPRGQMEQTTGTPGKTTMVPDARWTASDPLEPFTINGKSYLLVPHVSGEILMDDINGSITKGFGPSDNHDRLKAVSLLASFWANKSY